MVEFHEHLPVLGPVPCVVLQKLLTASYLETELPAMSQKSGLEEPFMAAFAYRSILCCALLFRTVVASAMTVTGYLSTSKAKSFWKLIEYQDNRIWLEAHDFGLGIQGDLDAAWNLSTAATLPFACHAGSFL